MDGVKQKWFLWGAALAWAPWIPTIFGVGNTLRGVSSEKATGLAAVAGGVVEMFALYGIVDLVVAEVAAIFFLWRAFERGHWIRSCFAGLSICLSGMMVLLSAFFLWFVWFRPHPPF
jgi:hypothetical protein